MDQPLGSVLVLVAEALTLLTYLIPGKVLDARIPFRRPSHRPARAAGFLAERLRQD